MARTLAEEETHLLGLIEAAMGVRRGVVADLDLHDDELVVKHRRSLRNSIAIYDGMLKKYRSELEAVQWRLQPPMHPTARAGRRHE